MCIVEKRKCEGRLQEWNINRHELQVDYDRGSMIILRPVAFDALRCWRSAADGWRDAAHWAHTASDNIAVPQILVELGLVTNQELEQAIATEFNPTHIGFHGTALDITAHDVLNLGVSPRCRANNSRHACRAGPLRSTRRPRDMSGNAVACCPQEAAGLHTSQVSGRGRRHPRGHSLPERGGLP